MVNRLKDKDEIVDYVQHAFGLNWTNRLEAMEQAGDRLEFIFYGNNDIRRNEKGQQYNTELRLADRVLYLYFLKR